LGEGLLLLRGSRQESNEDRFQNAFAIFNDVAVPEAEHLIPLRLQKGGAGCVDLRVMLTAVEFDDQHGFETGEIGHIMVTNRMLLAELEAANPWNTYRIDGLPPTPIANPGEASIAAVLNPLRTEDLFFVADGSGGHAFARTYQEHLANVARWREIERRKAGLPPEAPAVAAGPTDPAQDLPPGVVVPPGAQVIRVPQQPTAQTAPQPVQ